MHIPFIFAQLDSRSPVTVGRLEGEMNTDRKTSRRLTHAFAAITGALVVTGYLGWFWYTVATATGSTVIRVASLAFGIG